MAINQSNAQRWLLILLLVAALLRLTTLGRNSIWLDEALSVQIASHTQAEIWSGALEDRHPPLYYSLLGAWLHWAGASEWAIRLPTALVSIFNVLLLYALGRRLAGWEVAVAAAALLAVAPLDIWYAREARMYVFVAFAALLMAWGWSMHAWWGGAAAAVGLALGLYFDYTMIPLWIGGSAAWLTYCWGSQRYTHTFTIWGGSALLGWGFYLPWRTQLQSYVLNFNTLHVLVRLRQATLLPDLSGQQLFAAVTVAGLGGAAVIALLIHLLRRSPMRRLFLVLICVGFVAITLVGALPRFYIAKRVLTTGGPLALLLIAWAILQLQQQRQAILSVSLAISLAATLAMLIFVAKDDWRSVVARLNQEANANTIVWIDPSYNAVPYNHYQPVHPPQGGSVEQLATNNATEIWLVAERYPSSTIPASPSEQYLDQEWQWIESIPFYRLEVRHYRR